MEGKQTAAEHTWTGEGFPALLRGKVAVVTGAARGIGRAIAVDLARNGAQVVAVDLCGRVSPVTEFEPATRDDLEQTGRLLESIGQRWTTKVADIRKLGELRTLADEVEREFGGVDVVVANAGIQAFKPLLEMEDSDWHDIIDNNLSGTANTVRAFAPHLVKRGGGRLILISSMQGRYGMKNGSAYSASKWGIIGLMKSAALELGKYKITVNTIEPGLIDTPLTRNDRRWSMAVGETMTEDPPEHPSEEQTVQARLPKMPLGIPWLQPEQVAPVAVFLASAAAAMVTGACYDVTAGDSAHVTA
ncbi:MAG TPA: SDR family NAD(P)-dependent oxidoreductase [Acidobacteriaceae bacterium]|nr:SDR family NAD(P)-dependent oxidoreductase [Acidobacteriaceae bacterium]